MKTKLLRMARRLWSVEHVPVSVNRENQLKWARSVARLGDRWLLAQRVSRRVSDVSV